MFVVASSIRSERILFSVFQVSKIVAKALPDLLVIRQQETRRRLRAFVDASIVQLAKWVRENHLAGDFERLLFLFVQSGKKTLKKEILPQVENLFPRDWSSAADGSRSIYLLVALANAFPRTFDEAYFQSKWNEKVLPLGKTPDEQNTIKTTLQVKPKEKKRFFSIVSSSDVRQRNSFSRAIVARIVRLFDSNGTVAVVLARLDQR